MIKISNVFRGTNLVDDEMLDYAEGTLINKRTNTLYIYIYDYDKPAESYVIQSMAQENNIELRRAAAVGGEKVWVGSGQRFHEKIGFQRKCKSYRLKQPVPVVFAALSACSERMRLLSWFS